MKRKKDIGSKAHWYVKPIGSHTNEVIARRLAEITELTVGTNQSMKDTLGIEHSVFEVPSYAFITELQKSKADLGLKFDVFTRALNYGPIRLWLFGEKKKKSDGPVKKANQRLKELTKKKT